MEMEGLASKKPLTLEAIQSLQKLAKITPLLAVMSQYQKAFSLLSDSEKLQILASKQFPTLASVEFMFSECA